jgi:DNA end-binding protein Ku
LADKLLARLQNPSQNSYLSRRGISVELRMASARPFWKGYLKLSLVSCPIAMFPASSSSERVSFRQINKSTGNRLKQQLVDSETGDVVESADKGRGYEIGRNQYLPVEDEELEAPRLESTHTIDIEKFVPRSEIDERYLDSPYYLAPTDNVGQDAFAVIREAMKRKNMVGLGRAVISRRERIVMLEPFDKGMMATTLRYAYEVRDAAEYFDDIPSIKLPGEMVELAEHILDTKAGHFNATEFEDRYETAVVEMLKRKQAGLPPEQRKRRRRRTSSTSWTRCAGRSTRRSRGAQRRASRPKGRSRRRNPSLGRRRGRGRRAEGGCAAMATRNQLPTPISAKVKQRASKGPRRKRTRPEPRQYTLTDLDRAQDRVEAAERRVDSDRTNRPHSRAGLERAQRELHVIESDLRARGLF